MIFLNEALKTFSKMNSERMESLVEHKTLKYYGRKYDDESDEGI